MPVHGSQASSRLVDALLAAHEILEASKVRHALLGGIAANFYRREPRATRDVDFAVLATPADVVTIVEAFRRKGWRPEVRTNKTEVLRLVRKDYPRVDILVAGTPFEESAVGRAAKIVVERAEILVVTPEDLVIYKLIAGRAQDYEAVAAIINMMGELESAYIEGWLEQFGMSERWSRAREEAARLAADE
jgi:hypothetical protein